MSETERPAHAPAWPSFVAGFRATIGLAVAGGVFGILFGIIALAKGLDAGSTVLMSAAVFAGAAQVAALELWQEPLPYLAIFMAVLLVNSRHVLMGVTLHETLSANRRRPPFGILFVLTDANWVLTMKEQRAGNRAAFFAGSGFAMYSFWLVGTIIGVAAPLLLDARTLQGLAIGGALYIAILICIFFRGRKPGILIAPLASAAFTLLASQYVGSALALLAGVVAAAGVTLLRELRRRA
ncbi:MAG: AzlC family ABC transporter permease [Woeseia sp.]